MQKLLMAVQPTHSWKTSQSHFISAEQHGLSNMSIIIFQMENNIQYDVKGCLRKKHQYRCGTHNYINNKAVLMFDQIRNKTYKKNRWLLRGARENHLNPDYVNPEPRDLPWSLDGKIRNSLSPVNHSDASQSQVSVNSCMWAKKRAYLWVLCCSVTQ